MTLKFGLLWPFRNPDWARVRLGRALPLAPRPHCRLGADGLRPSVAHRAPLHRRRLLPVAVYYRRRYRRTDSPHSHRHLPTAAPPAQPGPRRGGHRHTGSHLRGSVRPWRGARVSTRRVRRPGHPCPRAGRTDAGKPHDRSAATVRRHRHDRRQVQQAARHPDLPAGAAAAAPTDLGWAERHRRQSSAQQNSGFTSSAAAPGSAEIYDSALQRQRAQPA